MLKRNEKENIIGNVFKDGGFKSVWFSKKHEEIINSINIKECRKPCKHDSYNIMFESIKNDYLHRNFI